MKGYITTSEAAEILGVTARRVCQLIAKKQLPAQTFGTGGRVLHLIRRADLDRVDVKKRPGPGRPVGAKNKN